MWGFIILTTVLGVQVPNLLKFFTVDTGAVDARTRHHITHHGRLTPYVDRPPMHD